MQESGGYPFPAAAFANASAIASGDTQPNELALRDYFAAAALQGILARGQVSSTLAASRSSLAAAAFEYADEMLKARER